MANTVRVDCPAFFAATKRLFDGARTAGRQYLTWEEWDAWAQAASNAGLLLHDELHDPPAHDGYLGQPFLALGEPDARFWRVAICSTWRRANESRERGDTAEEFHRHEAAASAWEASKRKVREAQDRGQSRPARRRIGGAL